MSLLFFVVATSYFTVRNWGTKNYPLMNLTFFTYIRAKKPSGVIAFTRLTLDFLIFTHSLGWII